MHNLDKLRRISIVLDKHHKRLQAIMQASDTSTPLDHEVLANAEYEAHKALNEWVVALDVSRKANLRIMEDIS